MQSPHGVDANGFGPLHIDFAGCDSTETIQRHLN